MLILFSIFSACQDSQVVILSLATILSICEIRSGQRKRWHRKIQVVDCSIKHGPHGNLPRRVQVPQMCEQKWWKKVCWRKTLVHDVWIQVQMPFRNARPCWPWKSPLLLLDCAKEFEHFEVMKFLIQVEAWSILALVANDWPLSTKTKQKHTYNAASPTPTPPHLVCKQASSFPENS